MHIGENILLALESLRTNKMRSLLTMLGIIIGVAAVIAIISLGDAMTNTVNEQMQSMGINNITVNVRDTGSSSNQLQQMATMMGMVTRRTMNDSEQLKQYQIDALAERYSDEIAAISLTEGGGQGQVKDVDKYANVSVTGVNPGYFTVNNTTLLLGRFVNDKDMEAKRKVCVVSDKLVSNMFGTQNPLGQQVRFYDSSGGISAYTIIGVYKYESMSMTVSDQDVTTTLYIPISTAKATSQSKNYASFTIMTATGVDTNTFTTQVENFMNRYYRNNPRYEASAMNMTSMVDTATTMLSTIVLVLAIIAGISLLVGGVGVMNIMLVSVTERTNEIGIRKALGARDSAIRLQFVTEAMIVTLIGGMIGIIIGTTMGSVGASLVDAKASLSVPTILLAVGFSMLVGVFFGFYPANKAAKLNPIDALRYE